MPRNRQAIARAGKEVERLALLLKSTIRSSGSSAAKFSRALGHAPAFLTRVFAGRLDLKVRELFALFALLGKSPEPFFIRHYPLGDHPPGGEEAPRYPGEPTLERLRELMEEAAGGPPTPEAIVAKARRLLQGKIILARTNQRQVARALGLREDAIGEALRGATELTTSHLFGILAVIGTNPGRFFAELFSPEDKELPLPRPRAEFWDALERLLAARPKAEPGEAGERPRKKTKARKGVAPRKQPRPRRQGRAPKLAQGNGTEG